MKRYIRTAETILPLRYVVYSFDIGDDEEIESLKSFSSLQLDAAKKYALKYAAAHEDEGLGAQIIVIPDDDPDAEDVLYDEGLEPYTSIWSTY